MRYFGSVVRGVRMPIIHSGDNLAEVVSETIFRAVDNGALEVKDHDVIALTESIVARAEGNYASTEAIKIDVRNKFPSGPVGFVFPILSRNRMLGVLSAIAEGVDELIVQLSYPRDEVGNSFVDDLALRHQEINISTDEFSEEEFRALFGEKLLHPITKMDYPQMYRKAARNIKVIFSNNPLTILKYTNQVIVADIHTRFQTKEVLRSNGGEIILGLDDLLTSSINGSGYHPTYGLLGSNFASEGLLKLFPRDGQKVVEDIQQRFYKKYGKIVEVLVFGDGAFKDPVSKIWELADPVVAPFYTPGLEGSPHESKFKLIADTTLKDKRGVEAEEKMKQYIKKHQQKPASDLGTTPRHLTDLLGSLADLTSGSGDKGTPVVYIQGYFDSYADE